MMKTNIYFITSMLFLFPIGTFAGWYGPTGPGSSYSQIVTGVSTLCPTDGQDAEVGPTSPDLLGPLPGSAGTQYFRQARVVSPVVGGVMMCQRWDNTAPGVTNINYPSGQNFNPTIFPSIQSTDVGGSGLRTYQLEVRYSNDFPTFGSGWSSWTSIPSQTNNPNFYFDTNSLGSGARGFQFRARVSDLAGNSSAWFTDSKIYQLINSGWYGPNGPYSVYYQDITTGGVNNCLPDSQPDLILPMNEYRGPNYNSLGLDGEFAVYRIQARANTTYPAYPSIPGKVSCQRWDTQNPTITSVSYTGGWTNNPNIRLSLTGTDLGGAGIWEYDIEMQYSDSSPTFASGWSTWISIGTGSHQTTYFDTTRGSANRAYKFRARARDRANNTSSYVYGSNTLMLDTVVPTPVLLNSSTPSRLLATTSQTINVNLNDPGSPVVLSGAFENYTFPSPSINVTYSPGYSYTHATLHNISLVDGADRIQDSGAARQYTYTITKIKDQAGNEWNGSKIFNYLVYANPSSSPAPSLTLNPGHVLALTNASAVANGSDYDLTLRLVDGYGNAIIPASGITRTITMNTDTINRLYLDQYTRTGNLGAFITSTTGPRNVMNGIQSFSNQNSNDGNYTAKIRAYVPTAGSYSPGEKISDINAQLTINSIGLTSNDAIVGTRSLTSAVGDIEFKSLFTSRIGGDLRNGGFIEGAVQDSTLDVSVNGSRLSGWSANPVHIDFSGTTAYKYNMYLGSPTPASLISSRTQLNSNPGVLPVSGYPIASRLEQKPGQVVDALSNLMLSIHFVYQIDGYTIVTNGDIIGKDSYHAVSSSTGTAYQVGVKIIGAVGSNTSNEIYANQYQTGVNIFGGINRSAYKNAIRKNLGLALRNVPTRSVGSSITSLVLLPTGTGLTGKFVEKDTNTSVLSIEGNGETVELNLSEITGVRTILLKGVNLSITQDLYYKNTKSILGVYIEKSDAGQGGNLYIDPDITNIVGTYVIDGAVSSYEGGSILDVSTSVNRLKNQLYIYGSILSENTLGGSRMNPIFCPTMLTIGSCTLSVAQQYDLNYLRRYYLIDSVLISPADVGKKTPFGSAKTIGGGTCTSAGVCSGGNPNLIKKFTTTSDDLASYPVIIEYNPLIKNLQPMGFDGIQE